MVKVQKMSVTQRQPHKTLFSCKQFFLQCFVLQLWHKAKKKKPHPFVYNPCQFFFNFYIPIKCTLPILYKYCSCSISSPRTEFHIGLIWSPIQSNQRQLQTKLQYLSKIPSLYWHKRLL